MPRRARAANRPARPSPGTAGRGAQARGAGAALFASLVTACAPVATRLTPDPAPPGVVQASFGMDGLYFRDAAAASRVPSLMFDVGARYGLADDLDIGLRLYTFGAEASVKWRALRGPIPVALAPAVSVAGTPDGGTTSKALYVYADLPIIAAIPLSDGVRLGLGPKLLYGWYRPVNGGGAQGLMLGGFLNVDLRPTGAWHLIPELGVLGTIAGEVPVRGLVGSVGLGVARDL